MEIEEAIKDLRQQSLSLYNKFKFPPFTLSADREKTYDARKQYEMIREQTFQNLQMGKIQTAQNAFAPLMAEFSSMFKEADNWIKKSNNDYIKAAEMYRASPSYKPGSLVAPIVTVGWVP